MRTITLWLGGIGVLRCPVHVASDCLAATEAF